MRHPTIIDIAKMSPSTMTRERAVEAYESLLPYLKKGAVTLYLDTSWKVGISFLDGLLFRLAEGDYLNSVSFKTDQPRLEEKLARLSAVRDINIYLYSESGIRKVTPKPIPEMPEPVFSEHRG